MGELNKKLLQVQKALKAPKNQKNKFGGYNYRSCEDILEAVKPLLDKNGLTLTISDAIVEVCGRIYVQATATVRETEGTEIIAVSAYAREPEVKKGMDDSQITGTASSYARKYALNGLFLIDDTKDADSNEVAAMGNQEAKKATSKKKEEVPLEEIPLPFPLEDEPKQTEWKCMECGNVVTGGKIKGKPITAAEVVKKSMDIFGDVFCYPCMIKKSQENGGK